MGEVQAFFEERLRASLLKRGVDLSGRTVAGPLERSSPGIPQRLLRSRPDLICIAAGLAAAQLDPYAQEPFELRVSAREEGDVLFFDCLLIRERA